MAVTTTIDARRLAGDVGLRAEQVEAVVALLDAGNTVPFITRYRKDQTGGLDEEQIRQVQSRIVKLRLLLERKQTILRSIESQGKLTPERAAQIEAADTTKRLEDLYLPFKPNKQTLATAARAKGLEPLAEEILAAAPECADLDRRAADFVSEERQVPTAADALLGAGHILAEVLSERADFRQALREIFERSGRVATAAVDPAADVAKPFRDYFEYREEIGRIPPHRILAINRGERIKALRVRIEVDQPALEQKADELAAPAEHPHAAFLRGCGRDALNRLVLPSLDREVRRELTDRAETHAVTVFARNLRNLLLQKPVRDRRVLAIDPGFKSGCKLVALDEFGSVLEHGLIHLVGKDERREQAKTRLVELIDKHQLSVVAIGNGTGCRETELLVAEVIAGPLAERGVAYVTVNEAGASVYSTSPVGREEFPDFDATLRGAISIGRRLQDPLSELVKIDPGNIGVGMYQHDVKARHLRTSLDEVVESCVNYVGVDVNSASPALLRYVSGLNQLTARRLYDHRVANGPFKSREELKAVAGMGEATFVQAAGFLKISGGANPLDATWIHPESYATTNRVLEKIGCSATDLAEKREGPPLADRVRELNLDALSAEMHVGKLLLEDIVAQFARPGRDPREDLSPPMFKREVLKLEHLSSGMELSGTVLNVVDFGAFVDIGLKDTGLVHISQLAGRYVPDPHSVVAVGDIVRVWVLSVDKDRRRVSLTMIPPGSAPRTPPRREKPKEQPTEAKPAGDQQRQQRPPRHDKPHGKRPAPARAGGGGAAGRSSGRSGGSPPAPPRPAKPRVPPKPLTKEMKEGKAPLRTFGDLMQFWQLQSQPEVPPPAGDAAGNGTPSN